MPEDADGEPTGGVLERLDLTVGVAGGDTEAGAEAGVALVVVRLHIDLGSENAGEAASGLDLDLVLRELTGRLLVPLVPDEVRQVLDQVAAERDVQHLRAAADREHRQVALERGREERELGPVALGTIPFVSACGSCPYRSGSRSEPPEKIRPSSASSVSSIAVLGRRHEQRPAARTLDAEHVALRHERRPSSPTRRTTRASGTS